MTALVTHKTFFTDQMSLTEQFVVRQLQSKYSQNSWTLLDHAVVRIIALSTSVFAAMDTACYLVKTVGSCLIYSLYHLNIIYTTSPKTAKDIISDINHVAMFAITTFIGSIIAVINPGIFCPTSVTQNAPTIVTSAFSTPDITTTDVVEEEEDPADRFDYQAFGMTEEEYKQALQIQRTFDLAKQNFNDTNTPVDFAIDPGLIPLDLPLSWEGVSEKVQDLWDKAEDVGTFQSTWKTTPLSEKRVFTHLLDIDSSDKGVAARANLANIIYKNAKGTYPGSNTTIPVTSWPKQTDAAYYHATRSEDALRAILNTEKVEVRHQGAFKGAFVSTQPETMYGNYILVFNRNVERMANIEHRSFLVSYWAGFKKHIPVNERTLQKVLYNTYSSDPDQDCIDLAEKLQIWTGRDIPVEKYEPSLYGHNMNHIIPREWTENPNYSY